MKWVMLTKRLIGRTWTFSFWYQILCKHWDWNSSEGVDSSFILWRIQQGYRADILTWVVLWSNTHSSEFLMTYDWESFLFWRKGPEQNNLLQKRQKTSWKKLPGFCCQGELSKLFWWIFWIHKFTLTLMRPTP